MVSPRVRPCISATTVAHSTHMQFFDRPECEFRNPLDGIFLLTIQWIELSKLVVQCLAHISKTTDRFSRFEVLPNYLNL